MSYAIDLPNGTSFVYATKREARKKLNRLVHQSGRDFDFRITSTDRPVNSRERV